MKTPALFDLTGRVVVVTGGNGGIGRSIALGLAEAGAAVAVFGRNDEKNQRVLSELKAIGVPSMAVKVDMTDRAGLEPALNRGDLLGAGCGSVPCLTRIFRSPLARLTAAISASSKDACSMVRAVYSSTFPPGSTSGKT